MISDFFQNDHREIDALLAAVPFEEPRKAVAAYEDFDRRLERHIIWEEEILFPAVCRKEACLEQGPVAVMRQEHVEIRRLKAAALEALRAGDGATARLRTEDMLDVLKPHNMKEEQILYPTCDELLGESEREGVLASLRR